MIDDPEGDGLGPGSYTYPANFTEGQFDVVRVEIQDRYDTWELTTKLSVLENQFDGDSGFSAQVIQLYFQDPNAPGYTPRSTEPRRGVVSSFEEDYHYRVHVEDGNTLLEHAGQDPDENYYEPLAQDFHASGDPAMNTISFWIPKGPFGSRDIEEMKLAMLVFCRDETAPGGINQEFEPVAGTWTFGGVTPGAIENAPRILDLVGPDDVVKQEQNLSYSPADSPTIPLFDAEAIITHRATGQLSAIAHRGPTLFGGTSGELDGSESTDLYGQQLALRWTQTRGPDATLTGADTPRPTITAPRVTEKTILEFELIVTDPDGGENWDTTTVKVLPQSANDPPIADAGESRMVGPGETVSLQAIDSEDPNGGTLSYNWTQIAGPDVELSGTTSIGPAFTTPDVETMTSLAFELTVDDGQGKSATDTVEVIVDPSRGSGAGDEADSGGTAENADSGSDDNGIGFGAGFGVFTGLLGAAGGAVYGVRSLVETEPKPPADERGGSDERDSGT